MQELSFKIIRGDRSIEEALEIRQQVFVGGQGVPLERELDGLDARAEHYIGYMEGSPVTTARVRLLEGSVAKIERVAVIPERQRQHVGYMLMGQILHDLKKRGIERATLDAQVTVKPFYEKLGFTAAGPVFEDAGMPHVHMFKWLDHPFPRRG